MRINELLAIAQVRTWIEENNAYFPEFEAKARAVAEAAFHGSRRMPAVLFDDLNYAAGLFDYEVFFAPIPLGIGAKALTFGRPIRTIYLPEDLYGSDRRYPNEDEEEYTRRLRHRPYRARFSLAHELGHIALEHPPQDEQLKTVEDWYGFYRREWEANYFAGALLMDEHEARDYLYTSRFDLLDFAEHFGVTYHSAAQRAVSATGGKIPFRFIQLTDKGHVRKSYASDQTIFPIPFIYAVGCQNWLAWKTMTNGTDTENFQCTILKNGMIYEKMFVRAKRVTSVMPTGPQKTVVSLSCRIEDARQYMKDFTPAVDEETAKYLCHGRCENFDTPECRDFADMVRSRNRNP